MEFARIESIIKTTLEVWISRMNVCYKFLFICRCSFIFIFIPCYKLFYSCSFCLLHSIEPTYSNENPAVDCWFKCFLSFIIISQHSDRMGGKWFGKGFHCKLFTSVVIDVMLFDLAWRAVKMTKMGCHRPGNSVIKWPAAAHGLFSSLIQADFFRQVLRKWCFTLASLCVCVNVINNNTFFSFPGSVFSRLDCVG